MNTPLMMFTMYQRQESEDPVWFGGFNCTSQPLKVVEPMLEHNHVNICKEDFGAMETFRKAT